MAGQYIQSIVPAWRRPGGPSNPPRLFSAALDAVMTSIAAAVGTADGEHGDDEDIGFADMAMFHSERWLRLKAHLHVLLSDNCLEHLYRGFFLQECQVPSSVARSALYREDLAEVEKSNTVNNGN